MDPNPKCLQMGFLSNSGTKKNNIFYAGSQDNKFQILL